MGRQMRCRHHYAVLCSTCPVLDSTQLGKDHGQRIRNRSLSMLACTVIPAGRFAATVAKGAVVFVWPMHDGFPATVRTFHGSDIHSLTKLSTPQSPSPARLRHYGTYTIPPTWNPKVHTSSPQALNSEPQTLKRSEDWRRAASSFMPSRAGRPLLWYGVS